MKKEDLLSFLQDIVEQDSDLGTLKYRYTKYGCGTYSLENVKKICIYGLEKCLFQFSKYVRKEEKYIDIDYIQGIEIIKKDDSWINKKDGEYYLVFKNIPHYFFILFGPNGPVGDHAMDGAKIPEEFEQFIVDE